MVGTALEGFVYLEYYPDAVKVVNRRSKLDCISFARESKMVTVIGDEMMDSIPN